MSISALLVSTDRDTSDALVASLALEINNNGVSPDEIDEMVKTLVSTSTPVFLSARLVSLLIPNKPINSKTVITIASNLGVSAHKPSLKIQISLLKWLCTVHPFLKDGQVLNSLYTVFFNYLSYESLRPYLCSLLFISTTAESVQPWRYDTLLQIKNKNRDPRTSGHVDALLTLYSHFKPFLHAPDDMKWSENAKSTVPPDEKLLEKIVHVFGNSPKAILYQSTAKLRDIVADIENPMPKQIPNVVKDSSLSRVFLLKSTQLDEQRLNRWLTDNMDEKAVLEWMRYTKNMPLAVVGYLVKAVKQGGPYKTTFWQLLSQLPLMNPVTFRLAFLQTLTNHPAELVESLTKLLQNWSTLLPDHTDTSSREACAREIHTTVTSLVFNVSRQVTLAYFEAAAQFTIKTSPTRPLVPDLATVQFYIAQADPATVARLARVLFLLRESSLGSESYKTAVTELSSALWSNRHMRLDEHFLETLASLLRFPVTVDAVFGLTMSSAFSHIAAVYMWSLEEEADIERRHEGPVTAQSLVDNSMRGGLIITSQQYKRGLLDFAEAKYGMKGLRAFFYVTMKSLKREEGGERKRLRVE